LSANRTVSNNPNFGNRLDKICHTRPVAYSEELILLNKHQILGGGAYPDCYPNFLPKGLIPFSLNKYQYILPALVILTATSPHETFGPKS